MGVGIVNNQHNVSLNTQMSNQLLNRSSHDLSHSHLQLP